MKKSDETPGASTSIAALSGRCACGGIRYHVAGAPLFSVQCHCRQCQRITGTGHSSQFGVPAAAVTLEGELAAYDLVADSGNQVKSKFCRRCGSPILKTTSGYPELLFIHAATLDEPSRFRPEKVVWADSAPPWDSADTRLPCG